MKMNTVILEPVHIGNFARLFGKFCRFLRQKSLPYVSMPAKFFLALGKIMLENTHTISMWTGSYC